MDAVHLPFRTNLRLKLGDSAQHIEQQASRGVAGVDVLVQHLQIEALAFQLIRNLA